MARSSFSASRTLFITPPVVSTNEFINYLLEDIEFLTHIGITCTTCEGKSLVPFGNIRAYIGDYVGAYHVLDIRGPTRLAFFHTVKFASDRNLVADQVCMPTPL